MAGMRRWALGLALAALALGATGQPRTAKIPEISSSILVFGPSDYLPVNGGQSRCQRMVQNALAYQQSSLMFVPTAFWVDLDYQQLKTVNSQGKVSYYCLQRTDGNGTTPTNCAEPTPSEIQALTSSMAACFKTAVDAGLDISVSPHLDDGLGFGGWRNGLVFDPLQKYGSYSYADFYLYPLADAMNQVLQPDTKVFFGMQGEMSATVMYNPTSYIQLLTLLKQRVLRGKSGYNPANIQVGVSTNFNKLCGCVLQDLVDTYQYVQLYPAAFAPLRSQFNFTAIAALYNQTDFIGISSYPSLKPGFTTQQLEAATEQFDFEIGQFGVNLKDLVVNKGKPLYWNEYGVGGGSSQNGQVKATTAAEAAQFPFFGVFGQYTRANDPWVLYDLQRPSPVRDYLRYFWNQTVSYAKQTGTNPAFKYIVSGIYIWNDASWDVQAIYPESSSQEGSYKDPVSTAAISAHNQAAMGAARVPVVTTVQPPSSSIIAGNAASAPSGAAISSANAQGPVTAAG